MAQKTVGNLVILRHGETEYNVKKLMTGQREVPLTQNGEDQAKEAGTYIRHIRFDKVYSSPLSRAFNTAAMALKSSLTQNHLRNEDGTWKIEKRTEITELDAGDFTGRAWKVDPEIVAWSRVYDVKLPNGESDKDVVDRVRKFFNAEVLPRLKRGENVLIASHSGTVHAFDIVLGVVPEPKSGEVPPKSKVPNAAPVLHVYEDGLRKSSTQLKPLSPSDFEDKKNRAKARKFGS
jgi:2,3-bisphosphoglycerate-dependent phosphoglycerate mutase